LGHRRRQILYSRKKGSRDEVFSIDGDMKRKIMRNEKEDLKINNLEGKVTDNRIG
jgi:hypothetical protein